MTLPATVIALEAGNIVTQVKTVEKDGYAAVQVGAGRWRLLGAGGCCRWWVLPLRQALAHAVLGDWPPRTSS